MADITYERRIGDRREGRRIRSFTPTNKIMPFFMLSRGENANFFSGAVETNSADMWINEKRLAGFARLELLHVFVAAYVRTVASCPAINRFVSGKHIYARHNIEVLLCLNDDDEGSASDTTIKVIFAPTDNVYDVYRKINHAIDDVRSSYVTRTIDDWAINTMGMPRFIVSGFVRFLHMLDNFDKLPESFLLTSPFHGSVSVTDLSALGLMPPYSTLNNFGNISSSLSIGARRNAVEASDRRGLSEKNYIDFSLVADKRICTSAYQAAAIKYLVHYMQNPKSLEKSPSEVKEDIF